MSLQREENCLTWYAREVQSLRVRVKVARSDSGGPQPEPPGGDDFLPDPVFDNPTEHPVGFGEGTSDEMCFNFVLAYPIDQLSKRNCGIIF